MSVTAIARDLYQVRLPLPFALNHVNCYLLREPDGWSIVDSGLHTEAGEAGWRAAFAELDIAPAQIRRVVLTHFHPDHFGMAGWLQQISGAPVLLAPREIELAGQVWGKPDDAPDPMVPLFLAHGLPDELVATIAAMVDGLRAATRPHPTLTPLEPGAGLELGGRRFTAIQAPGHSDGQLMLHDADARLILSGDHVLVKITPHIGSWPESEPDPLGRYLASLEALAGLDVAQALPGHGRTIEDWPGRLAELRAHHEARLNVIGAAVGPAASAYAVATRVFDFARFTPHEMRFAVAETIAHLELLVRRGALRRDDAEMVTYAAA
jgi:glyoxylase-like metal-dependent hydrolase (beta-lactamase superfamily II)